MSQKYKFHKPKGVYFTTFAVQEWVDVFTRNEYKDIIVENLAYCQKHKDLEIFAWCVMSNHLHLVARAKEDNNLPSILRDFKKFTAKVILKAIEDNERESRREWLLEQFRTKNGNRFWRGDNKPIELWSNAVIDQKLSYLHNNPVEEELVFSVWSEIDESLQIELFLVRFSLFYMR